jgi:hypothetical protein
MMVGITDMPTYGLDRFETHVANWQQRNVSSVAASLARLGRLGDCTPDPDTGDMVCSGSGGGSSLVLDPSTWGATGIQNPSGCAYDELTQQLVCDGGAPASGGSSTTLPVGYGTFGSNPVIAGSSVPGTTPGAVTKTTGPGGKGVTISFSIPSSAGVPGITPPKQLGYNGQPVTTTTGQLIPGIPNTTLFLGLAVMVGVLITSR